MEDFDEWNELKKKIESTEYVPGKFPEEGEVWITIFGKNIGYEQNGSSDRFARPGLVIKKFNNRMVWIVPLSLKQKDFDFYFNFTDPRGVPVSAILAQLRLVSTKRLEAKMHSIDTSTYLKIKEKLRSFI